MRTLLSELKLFVRYENCFDYSKHSSIVIQLFFLEIGDFNSGAVVFD